MVFYYFCMKQFSRCISWSKKNSVFEGSRKIVARSYSFRSILKSMCHDVHLSTEQRFSSFYHMYLLDGQSTKLRNRCMLTGRPRSVYRQFRLARSLIRELASTARLTGIRKSSW
jgi:small subunit ribosomal protein S14